MIAVIEPYFDLGIKLIPNTEENRQLLEAAAAEVGTKGIFPNTDKLDTLLKDIPVTPGIVACTAAFVHVSEW